MKRNTNKAANGRSPAALSRWVSLIGIIALAAVIGLGLAGCPTEDDDDPSPPPAATPADFTGPWSGTATIDGQSAAATITVTATNWTFVCTSAGMNETGTYTISSNVATLKSGTITIGTATLSGNNLSVVLTDGNYAGGTGIFTK